MHPPTQPAPSPKGEVVPLKNATGTIIHKRPRPDGTFEVVSEETVSNLLTKAGRDFLIQQTYSSSPSATASLRWIALSNDTLTETVDSTTLSNEITTAGLARAEGTVSHTAGTATVEVEHTFTATGAVTCRKAALLSASSSGSIHHILAFASAKTLASGETLTVRFTITYPFP
jgi:hypothetical protein